MNPSLKRRAFIGSAALASTALAGCSFLQGVANGTVPVTLVGAQAEAAAIYAAFKQVASGFNLSSTESTVLGDLGTAVTDFAAITPGESYITLAEQVVADATPLLSLLPVSGPTLIAIQAGIALVEALAKGLSSVPAPAATTGALLGAKPVVIIGANAPIPIPVPVS